jgi:phospholipase/lecithinase/hemolysin
LQLWRDTYHPGTGIHKLVAAKVTKALKDIKFW